MMYGIFDTAEVIRRRNVAGDTHDEKIADSLIEQDLGRNSRIAATQDRGKRVLFRDQLLSPGSGFMSVAEVARDEAFVPLLQKREGVDGIRRYRIFGLRLNTRLRLLI